VTKKPQPDARTVVPGHDVTSHDVPAHGGVRPRKIDELIANSSVGAALADVKVRGIDAHLADLEREMRPRRRAKRPAVPTARTTDDPVKLARREVAGTHMLTFAQYKLLAKTVVDQAEEIARLKTELGVLAVRLSDRTGA
jgi:hypothetical protein